MSAKQKIMKLTKKNIKRCRDCATFYQSGLLLDLIDAVEKLIEENKKLKKKWKIL